MMFSMVCFSWWFKVFKLWIKFSDMNLLNENYLAALFSAAVYYAVRGGSNF